ncbi:MAG: hypothetical protein PHO37_17495, partial [Kiritimatiellae bacterium]|nr:hypothetical protein [Kiritimatiellia bacterium]
WSVVSGGVTFYGGQNTGREVIIKGGAAESEFKLEVQVDGLPDSCRPYIHGRVLTPRTVQIRAYVICSNGVEAVSTATINGWIDEANRIYRQVAMTFTLVETNYVPSLDWFNIANAGEFQQMCSYANNTDGLELYCVGSTWTAFRHASSLRRFAARYGGECRRIPADTLAHEIGHACGLSDMYLYDAGDGLLSEEKTYPLNWSGGNGTGYYSPTLSYRDLTHRIIMHNHDQTDIPLYYLSGMCASIRVQISVGLPTMGTREPAH